MGLTQKLGTIPLAILTDASNNVGIGAAPSGSYKLEVTGTGRFTSRLNVNAASGFAELYVKGASSTTGMYLFDNNTESGLWKVDSGYMAFATTNVERMRITSAGNVGIGTSAPITKLQISNVSGADLLSFGISDYQAWVGGKIDLQGISAFGADMAFYTHPANSSNNATVVERMRITSGGEVSINTTSTTARFNIAESAAKWAQIINHTRTAGQFFIQFVYNGSEIGAISGNSSNTTYATSSDYRLKEDLKDFNGLDLVSKLNVYDFAWKLDNTRRMYGVLAHELSDIIPYAVNKEKDLVNEDGSLNVQGVDYSLITPLLVKAIQELNERLNKAGL